MQLIDIFKEAWWGLHKEDDLPQFNKFLDSKEFEDLMKELRAVAYYRVMNWIERNGK
jgi:hypothetical protein